MASRGLGLPVRWKHLRGATREPLMFYPGTRGVASTTTSSSVPHGRLTPEEREAEKRSEDPRKIREYIQSMMDLQREFVRNQMVTNQLLENIVKNTAPRPSGWLDTLKATWGYK